MKTRILFILYFYLFNAYSQVVVEVRDEPRHRPVFENQYIRLLNVIIPPGDTSLYHRHVIPSVFIFLEQTAIGMQDIGKQPGQMITEQGQTWFNGYEKGAQIHRAWTTDKQKNLHAIDIEILKFNVSDDDLPISHPALELISESTPVRIYRLKILPGDLFKINSNKNPLVIVPYSGSVNINGKKLGRSSFTWWSKKSLKISTSERELVNCYLYEIRT